MEEKKSSSSYIVNVDKNKFLMVAAVVVLMALSFWAGTFVHKNNKATLRNAGNYGMGAGFGGRGSFGNRAIGAVTSVSSTSITVNDIRTNTSKTYNVTSSTVVTSGSTASNISAVSVGNNVVVSGDSSNNATRIMISSTN
jgi:hypothetical protein